MEENNTTHDQSLTNHPYKKSKIEDRSCNKNGHMSYFTICQHRTEEPTNIEIFIPIFLKFWLF